MDGKQLGMKNGSSSPDPLDRFSTIEPLEQPTDDKDKEHILQKRSLISKATMKMTGSLKIPWPSSLNVSKMEDLSSSFYNGRDRYMMLPGI